MQPESEAMDVNPYQAPELGSPEVSPPALPVLILLRVFSALTALVLTLSLSLFGMGLSTIVFASAVYFVFPEVWTHEVVLLLVLPFYVVATVAGGLFGRDVARLLLQRLKILPALPGSPCTLILPRLPAGSGSSLIDRAKRRNSGK